MDESAYAYASGHHHHHHPTTRHPSTTRPPPPTPKPNHPLQTPSSQTQIHLDPKTQFLLAQLRAHVGWTSGVLGLGLGLPASVGVRVGEVGWTSAAAYPMDVDVDFEADSAGVDLGLEGREAEAGYCSGRMRSVQRSGRGSRSGNLNTVPNIARADSESESESEPESESEASEHEDENEDKDEAEKLAILRTRVREFFGDDDDVIQEREEEKRSRVVRPIPRQFSGT